MSADQTYPNKKTGEQELDITKLHQITLDEVKGKLTPIEISEYNNILAEVRGEISTALNAEEVEHLKQRLSVLHRKLH